MLDGDGTAAPPVRSWRQEARGYRVSPRDLLLPGIDRVRQLASSTPLPMTDLVGLRVTGVEAGRVRMSLPYGPWLGWPPDGETPAALAGLVIDAATGLAVVTTLPAGATSATAELSVGYARPPGPGAGTVDVEAAVVGAWGDWVLVEAATRDERGPVGRATSHCLRSVRGGRAAAPEPAPEPGTPSVPDQGAAVPLLAGYREQARSAPLVEPFGVAIATMGGGTAVLTMPATRWIARDGWTVLGGALVLLAELTMAAAGRSVASADARVLESKTSFVRRVRADGRELRATANVGWRGRRSGLATAEVRAADGSLAALASATLALS
ncbi:MAG TPA: hotdog fold thioesterase [Candidatus Dormibacteraeota bacterium]|nr:hotdog fold thioesterase [Candidatus Dormibacteraeota bacterium]